MKKTVTLRRSNSSENFTLKINAKIDCYCFFSFALFDWCLTQWMQSAPNNIQLSLEMAQKTCKQAHCNADCFFCKELNNQQETPRPTRSRPFPEPYPEFFPIEQAPGMSDMEFLEARQANYEKHFEQWRLSKTCFGVLGDSKLYSSRQFLTVCVFLLNDH